MKMNRYSVVAALASAAVLGLSACSTSSSSNPQAARTAAQAANAGNFTTVYFLGDSLTAGFQSDSLIDTSQPHGWANVVATQLGFPISLPLIAPPGAPNQITMVHLSPLTLGTLPGTTTGRDNFTLQPTDVAVPGALTNDVMNTVPLLNPTAGQEQLNQLVLGYPGFGYGVAYSQAQQAVAANPTTIFLWIGNNDTLVADETGMPSSMTPLATFTTQYQQLVQYLLENTNAHLIIANIPDVTAVPYLTPATEVLAETSAETGVPVANLSVILGISAGDLVNPTGTAEIPLILAGQQAGPITDSGFLSPTEIAAVQAQVKAFNQVIAQQATAAGATLVDVNALFAQVTANGINENGYPGTTAFLGGMFSLDGIHPTNTGYAILANTFISAINSGLNKTYPAVNVSAIAAVDPLYPPYPGHHFVKGEAMQAKGYPVFPAAVMASMKEIFGPRQ